MRSNQTPVILAASYRIYGILLFFYPSRLRHRFGQEMQLVFQDEIQSGWEKSGYKGFLENCCRASTELILVALPARLESAMLPAISVLGSFAFLAAALWIIWTKW